MTGLRTLPRINGRDPRQGSTSNTMPARYMTYPKGGPVLLCAPRTPRHGAGLEALDVNAATQWGWGELRVHVTSESYSREPGQTKNAALPRGSARATHLSARLLI
jgi:hypothetical protein